MKRFETNDRLPPDEADNMHPMVRELDGYLEIGMEDEVARLARQCFTGKRVEPQCFAACVHALLTHADDLAEWKPLVTEAFARLSQRGRRRVRYFMLSLHCSLGDYATAQGFLAKRFKGPSALMDLAFALDTLRELGRPDDARRLWPRAASLLDATEAGVDRSMLADSLARSMLEVREWDAAIQLWEGLVDDACLAESANLGLVELHLKRALLAAETGLTTVEKLKRTHDPELENMLPGNNKARWTDLETKLRQLRQQIEQPAKQAA